MNYSSVERDTIYLTIFSYKIKYAERNTQDSSKNINIFNIKKENDKYVCTYNYDMQKKNKNKNQTKTHTKPTKITTKKNKTKQNPLKYFHYISGILLISDLKSCISPLSYTYTHSNAKYTG